MSIRCTAKLNRKSRVLMYSSSISMHSPLPTCTLRQNGRPVTTDDPALTRSYHRKSTVRMRVPCWDCAFCGLGRYKCSITYRTEQSSLFFTYSSFPYPIHPTPCNQDNLAVATAFPFPRVSHSWNHIVCCLFR